MLTMKGPVTEAGYLRQEARVLECKAAYEKVVADLHNDRGGENSAGEARLSDMGHLYDEKRRAHENWVDAEKELAQITKAPIPRQCRKVQVNHQVTIKYLDTVSKKARGDEETFILGGQGESDTDSPLRTYSCSSPLGRAVVSREVGDERYVTMPNGEDYDIEITGITIPSTEVSAANAA